MIFVTGGTGLVGRHVLIECRTRGIPTTALVRNAGSARAVRELGAVPLEGRVDDPEIWDRVNGCQAIVHSAALIASRAPWDTYRRVNVDSVRLAAARAHRLGIPLVHISSVAVYGARERSAADGTVDEGFPIGPLDDPAFYPRSKRLAEQVLWEAVGGGLRALALRPTLIYGEGDRQFLPRVVAFARHGWLPLFGAGDRPLSLVHARNIAHAALQALALDRGWGSAFNLVNEDSVTAREFIHYLATGLGRRIRAVPVPLSLAMGAARLGDGLMTALFPGTFAASPSGAVRYWRGGNPFSVAAARRELGWNPPIGHREGLPAAVRAIGSG